MNRPTAPALGGVVTSLGPCKLLATAFAARG